MVTTISNNKDITFSVSVRGFDVPENILLELNTDSSFCVIAEKKYFYSTKNLETHIPEEIDYILEQTLVFAEMYADTFKAISESNGTVELYITFYTQSSGGFILPRSVVKRISELNMSIGID